MEYATSYIVRFEGTLTQGPNKGKTFTFATSWGGAQFATEEEVRAMLVKYRQLEPDLQYRLLRRQFQGGRKGKFVETEVPI